MSTKLTQEQQNEMETALNSLKQEGIVGDYDVDIGMIEINDPESMLNKVVSNTKEGLKLAFPDRVITEEMVKAYINMCLGFVGHSTGEEDVKVCMLILMVDTEIDKTKGYKGMSMIASEVFKDQKLETLN